MKRVNKTIGDAGLLTISVAAVLLLLFAANAQAQVNNVGVIIGINGPSFNLTAIPDQISTADGASILIWGFADGAARAQYPGPTLIVNQGDTVEVTLTNSLTGAGPLPNVSIVFPGHQVTAAGGAQGLLTKEAVPGGGTVTYTFEATHPGTYIYHSGTRPELQIEMGLVGALIVRPTGFDQAVPANRTAYGGADSAYDREWLFFHTEMDSKIHQWVQFFGPSGPEMIDPLIFDDYRPNYWFYNGRAFPDILLEDNVSWLPTQPYGTLPLMQPGERLLQRWVGGGRDSHPPHPHGNHATLIAWDGRLLSSAPGMGADLSAKEFTFNVTPGETLDAIFEWTGKDLGFDIYGDYNDPDFAHDCEDLDSDGHDDISYEWCANHERRFTHTLGDETTVETVLPVLLPELQDLTFGGIWSGSPFLGSLGALPPGEGGLNPWGAFTFPWHSHAEKELTNDDIFPGGMLTFMFVLPPGTL